MKGFFGKILDIDLDRESFSEVPVPDEVLRECLGGKGLASRLLLERNPSGVDPLSPGNHLIFAIGPLTGSPVWGSCRYGVYTKSPLTGLYAESYAGGTAAEYMSRTGFDLFMMHGASSSPVWIEISPEGVLFHEAGDLWGLDTFESEDRVRSWIRRHRAHAGKCGVVCIGPAGENRVRFAVIENDYWRSAGRTGVGAVMGSKKVKAVAFWGNRKKEMADPEYVSNYAREFAGRFRADKGVSAYKRLGTAMMVDILDAVESFPTRYWHRGRAAHREKINAAALHKRLDVRPHACLKCFVACGRLATVKEGPYRGLRLEGPEYETIYAFGGLCEVARIEDIAYLNDICDRLGLDTITAGNLAAFTIEAARCGRIPFDIDYGRTDRIARLLKETARREGIGEVLAHGIRTAAARWGMEAEAIHVKGMEPAGYDPRVFKGMGLGYATSPRGACHLRGSFYKAELAGMIDPDRTEGKAEMFVEWEDRLIIFDSLILCRFYRDICQWEELARMLRGVTGLSVGKDDLRSLAAGISNDTRRFNIREGLTPRDDRLPGRFFNEALPGTGKIITPGQMRRMVREYYRARGWDGEGRPPS